MSHYAAHSNNHIMQELENVPGTFPYRMDTQLALVLAALLISDQLKFMGRYRCGKTACGPVYTLVNNYKWNIKRVDTVVRDWAGYAKWETVYSIDKETIERALNEGGDKFVMTVLQVHLALKTIAS